MIRYPSLFDETTQSFHAIPSSKPFTIGRGVQADLSIAEGPCAPRQFRISRGGDAYYLEPLSLATPTLCNSLPVTTRQRLDHDSEIRVGANRFRFVEFDPAVRPPRPIPTPSPEPRVAPAPPVESPRAKAPAPLSTTRDPIDVRKPSPPSSAHSASHPVVGRLYIGRDEAQVQIVLLHPNVSRVHARIDSIHGSAVVNDLGSANGTFLNGERITRSAKLRQGDRIDIGPFGFIFDGKTLTRDSRVDNLELVGRDLRCAVTNRDTRGPLVLLNGVTIVIRPHEFVCILGPSGSGKSTLLSVLSARRPYDEGQVVLNGMDLSANFESLKQDIAVVPQRDLLHELLTVEEALHFTARLRLPPDTTAAEIKARVEQILTTVGLTELRSKPIRLLSGGQSKRASLANEILSKPSLLFLDEVTSGLDEQTDAEIMGLFREVATSGKTVVCITHSTANIERNCHLVVFLAAGGNLAFVGTPAEALGYFGVSRIGDVYERLATGRPEQWRLNFLDSPFHSRYVAGRLPLAAQSNPAAGTSSGANRVVSFKKFKHQAGILTSRYVRVMLRDFATLTTMIVQSLTVAALLVLLFRDEPASGRGLMFLLAVASIWFGCNNSAKEIVKERTVYSRERNVNLIASSYYLSKFSVLACLSIAQASLLLGLVSLFCEVDASTTIRLEWMVLSALAVAGVALGLLISAWAKSVDQAVAAVPIALLPQLILGGGIAQLRDGTVVKWLARSAVTTYWGFDSMFLRTGRDSTGHEPLTVAWMMMPAHVVAMAALAMILLKSRSADSRPRLRLGRQPRDPARSPSQP